MPLYMISGKTKENCIVKIIQDDEYRVEKKFEAGEHIIYFETDSFSDITVVVENMTGMIIGFWTANNLEVLKPNVLSEES